MESKDTKTKKIRVRGTGCFDLSDNSFGFTAYNDAPSFTRSFKNTFGITPSQYKLNKEKSG